MKNSLSSPGNDQSITIKDQASKRRSTASARGFKSNKDQDNALVKLSSWQDLPQLELSEALSHIYQSVELTSAQKQKQGLMKQVKLSLKHHFCHSNNDGTYLMHQGNQSPSLSWPHPPSTTDHLLLFVLDLDAYFPHFNKVDHLVTHVSKEPSQKKEENHSRSFPMVLWAKAGLDRSLLGLTRGFGSDGLKLKGKSQSSSYHGMSLSNDYTRIFISKALKGLYYDYDGPCILKHDPLRQHRVLVLLIASPNSADMQDVQQLKMSYNAPSKSFRTAPAWQILNKIFTKNQQLRHSAKPRLESRLEHSYKYSAALIRSAVDQSNLFELELETESQ